MSINPSTFSSLSRRPSVILHVLAFCISAGFGVHHLFFDVPLIGLAALLSSGFCGKAIYNLVRHEPKSFEYCGFYGFQFIALIATCYIYGLRGLILIYPITSSLFYIFSYRIAFWLAMIYFLAAMVASSGHFDLPLLIRIGVALSTSVVISAGFSYIVFKQHAQLDHEVNHDFLTQILNRRGYTSALTKLLEQKRSQKTDLAILYFDLDGFKAVNDTFGHDTGDKLLSAFAARVKGHLRSNESFAEANKDQLFARISGDEFILTISNVDKVGIENIVKRLIQLCKAPFNLQGNQIEVSVSIGICFASQCNYDFQTLHNYADTAMYRAKESHTQKYSFHLNQ